jgi:hypothetical protein
MGSCPIKRVTRMVTWGREVLDRHAEECGDRVLAFVLHPTDHEAMAIIELWGLPVLSSNAIVKGKVRLLCEANAVLIPPYENVGDLIDRWAHH